MSDTEEPPKFPQFARNFKIACKLVDLHDLQQIELGKLIGVSGPMVNKYRKGRALPSMETAVKICSITGVSLNWLLMNKGDMSAGAPFSLDDVWKAHSKEDRLALFSRIDSTK